MERTLKCCARMLWHGTPDSRDPTQLHVHLTSLTSQHLRSIQWGRFCGVPCNSMGIAWALVFSRDTMRNASNMNQTLFVQAQNAHRTHCERDLSRFPFIVDSALQKALSAQLLVCDMAVCGGAEKQLVFAPAHFRLSGRVTTAPGGKGGGAARGRWAGPPPQIRAWRTRHCGLGVSIYGPSVKRTNAK